MSIVILNHCDNGFEAGAGNEDRAEPILDQPAFDRDDSVSDGGPDEQGSALQLPSRLGDFDAP